MANIDTFYEAVQEHLKKVDFGAIWKDFTPSRFALYNEELVCFDGNIFPADNRFLGNTCISFEGENIAIWAVKASDMQDLDLFTANMIHEMFHVHQQNCGETRYPNDLALLDYPDSFDNHLLRLYENRLLAQAYRELYPLKKREYLKQYAQIKKFRTKRLGVPAKQECYAETIEGMAEYCGTIALRQLSPEKFQKRMDDYLTRICEPSSQFFEIRRLSYFTGAIACVAFHDAGMDFYHQLGADEDSLFEIIAKKHFMNEESHSTFLKIPQGFTQNTSVNNSQDALRDAYTAYMDYKTRAFGAVRAHCKEKVEGDFIVCGYDPMNMLRLNDEMLCTRFVTLAKDHFQIKKFIQGPVILKIKKGTYNYVSEYWIHEAH